MDRNGLCPMLTALPLRPASPRIQFLFFGLIYFIYLNLAYYRCWVCRVEAPSGAACPTVLSRPLLALIRIDLGLNYESGQRRYWLMGKALGDFIPSSAKRAAGSQTLIMRDQG